MEASTENIYLVMILVITFIDKDKEVIKINLIQKLCKHKVYEVIKCEKEAKQYTCRCCNCKLVFTLPKAVGEVYSNMS